MKIYAKLEVSQNTSSETFDLEDLGVTEEEWENLSYNDKKELIAKAVLDLPDQPYWMLDNFSEK